MSKTSTHWRTQDERHAWQALTGVLTQLPAALDAQLTKDAGLTFFEYTVLAELSEAPGQTLRMTQLSERTNGSLSRLSHVVRRLHEAGLVRRETAPDDRRATNATLTDEGLQRVQAAAPRHVEFARNLVLDVADSADLGTIGRFGEKVLDQIADSRRQGSQKRAVALVAPLGEPA